MSWTWPMSSIGRCASLTGASPSHPTWLAISLLALTTPSSAIPPFVPAPSLSPRPPTLSSHGSWRMVADLQTGSSMSKSPSSGYLTMPGQQRGSGKSLGDIYVFDHMEDTTYQWDGADMFHLPCMDGKP
jgi:hypothetical protein